ncbi:MAG: DUF4058 family protein [Pirellulaceae bacterium]|nr:DUF4058 family protein [Pirellulaceae bacterium]
MFGLLDHFRPPLSQRRHWHSFHNAWCTYLSSALNEQLPPGYFAEPSVQFGIEIDVATWEEAGGGGAEPATGWQAPAPTLTVPIAVQTDLVEVLVFEREAGPTLAGAIELVSPANKDRQASREAFVSKGAAYLQQGIGLLIVDIVTDRHARLHDELLRRLLATSATTAGEELYAAAYRPVEREGETNLDIWQETLRLGEPLPTLPLWLRGNLCLRVDLAATYERTCREQRIVAGDNPT